MPYRVFLHKKSVKVSKASKKRLEEAGYIVLDVENYDDVKVIEMIPVGIYDEILKAAISSIADCDDFITHGRFAKRLAKQLSGSQ